MLGLIRTATALVILTASTAMVSAADLAAPTDDVVLTISGGISATNSGKAAALDRAMLSGMPRTEFTTSTIWTEGEVTFSGVSLKALMDRLGAEGGKITATAINNYSVEIPMDSLGDYPIVADLMDGKPMSIRDKGPLWIVFPFDSGEEFQTEVIYSRSIWQLDRLEVSP